MPLRPNFLERLMIKWGKVPAPMVDGALPGFLISAIVGAGKVGLFESLKANEPASPEEIAAHTNCNPQAIDNLLRVLKPLGYVSEKNGEYSLTKYAKNAVPFEQYEDFSNFLGTTIQLCLSNVETALREAPEEGVVGWDRVKEGDYALQYQRSMRWLAGTSVGEVTKKVKLPKGSKKMLDIGGSHGLYCVEMCRKYPELKATVLDWSIGLKNARETLEEETDVANRIDLLEADFFEDEFPEGYDYAFLGNIIHGNNPEQNQELFNKLGEKLSDLGTIGILDQFNNLSGSRFARSVAALAGWNLFLFSNGRAYEVNDVKQWLANAGFPKVSVKPLKKSPGFTLLIAEKE